MLTLTILASLLRLFKDVTKASVNTSVAAGDSISALKSYTFMQDPIQIVSHYALQRKLSHKAGRQTFLAKDLRTHVPVIVKVLQLDSVESWSELKLFQREAQILQQLSHPAIPEYKESFEADVDGVTSFVFVQSYIAA